MTQPPTLFTIGDRHGIARVFVNGRELEEHVAGSGQRAERCVTARYRLDEQPEPAGYERPEGEGD